MPVWRADYFDNKDDKQPVHSELIDAKDENEAANKAADRAGGWQRVDVTRTIVRGRN